jgi:hypothetical protein
MAGVGALFHVCVFIHASAIVGALGADHRAGPAGLVMQIRPAQHEIAARVADLHAIHHQPDVVRVGVLAAHVQAMLHRFEADVVAAMAFLGTAPHLIGNVLMVHVFSCLKSVLTRPDARTLRFAREPGKVGKRPIIKSLPHSGR